MANQITTNTIVAIQSRGVFVILLDLIILPIIYTIPQSLMCTELEPMMQLFHALSTRSLFACIKHWIEAL